MRLAAGREVINVRRRRPWRITYYSSVWLCRSASNRSVSSALQPAISRRLIRRPRCPARAAAAPPEIRAATCRPTAAQRTATWTWSPSAPHQLTWRRHENETLIKMPSPYLMVLPMRLSHQHTELPLATVKLLWNIITEPFTPARRSKLLWCWIKYDSLAFFDVIKYITLRSVKEVLVPRQSSCVLDFVVLRHLKPGIRQWGLKFKMKWKCCWRPILVLHILLRLLFGFEKDCSKRVFTVSYGPSKNKPIIKDWGQIFLSNLKRKERSAQASETLLGFIYLIWSGSQC